MPITPTPHIWMNGEMVAWDEARIHVLSHTLHYGTGVFEGIRAYETEGGPAIFRLTEHIERLFDSAHIMRMPMPYSVSEIIDACKMVVADTKLCSCYLRPIAYFGYGEMGLSTQHCKTDIAIAAWPWGAYLGEDAATKGVRLKVSSWKRHDHNIMPAASKTTGNYANSTLAKMEAMLAGYDEAVMLNGAGLVAECSGENIFVGRGGRVVSPPTSAGALNGITQDTVTQLASDLGISVCVGEVSRSDLYLADEIFVVGTAAEVSAVNSVDDRAVACPGLATKAIAEAYSEVVRGKNPKYRHWNELAT